MSPLAFKFFFFFSGDNYLFISLVHFSGVLLLFIIIIIITEVFVNKGETSFPQVLKVCSRGLTCVLIFVGGMFFHMKLSSEWLHSTPQSHPNSLPASQRPAPCLLWAHAPHFKQAREMESCSPITEATLGFISSQSYTFIALFAYQILQGSFSIIYLYFCTKDNLFSVKNVSPNLSIFS